MMNIICKFSKPHWPCSSQITVGSRIANSRSPFHFLCSWKSALAQPFFGHPIPPVPVTCGAQYRFYNTSLTTGQYAPLLESADLTLQASMIKELPQGLQKKSLKGARFDVAFIEDNYLNCKDLA